MLDNSCRELCAADFLPRTAVTTHQNTIYPRRISPDNQNFSSCFSYLSHQNILSPSVLAAFFKLK